MDNVSFILQRNVKNALERIKEDPGSIEVPEDIIEKLQELGMVNANQELTEKGLKCLETIQALYGLVP